MKACKIKYAYAHTGKGDWPTSIAEAYNVASRYQGSEAVTATYDHVNMRTVFVVDSSKERKEKKREEILKEKHGGNYVSDEVRRKEWKCHFCEGTGHAMKHCPELEACKKNMMKDKEEEAAIVAFTRQGEEQYGWPEPGTIGL